MSHSVGSGYGRPSCSNFQFLTGIMQPYALGAWHGIKLFHRIYVTYAQMPFSATQKKRPCLGRSAQVMQADFLA
ncbi:hypothetical protein [Acetobacter ascendens]|uniref:hypothetical protein n=1 Tax=Acetobacter ascendens TaxID=481146 RepID=UPI00138FF27A|nr:hypothetical protein [Acetobacter ascendens]